VCSQLLEIDSKSITDNNLLEKYNDLVEKTYKKASELFYFEGYENYKTKIQRSCKKPESFAKII